MRNMNSIVVLMAAVGVALGAAASEEVKTDSNENREARQILHSYGQHVQSGIVPIFDRNRVTMEPITFTFTTPSPFKMVRPTTMYPVQLDPNTAATSFPTLQTATTYPSTPAPIYTSATSKPTIIDVPAYAPILTPVQTQVQSKYGTNYGSPQGSAIVPSFLPYSSSYRVQSSYATTTARPFKFDFKYDPTKATIYTPVKPSVKPSVKVAAVSPIASSGIYKPSYSYNSPVPVTGYGNGQSQTYSSQAYVKTPLNNPPSEDEGWNHEYRRVFQQMGRSWEKMKNQLYNSGIDNDWRNVWSKLTSSVEPYLSEISGTLGDALNVVVRQQHSVNFNDNVPAPKPGLQKQRGVFSQMTNSFGRMFRGEDSVRDTVADVFGQVGKHIDTSLFAGQQFNGQPIPTFVVDGDNVHRIQKATKN